MRKLTQNKIIHILFAILLVMASTGTITEVNGGNKLSKSCEVGAPEHC